MEGKETAVLSAMEKINEETPEDVAANVLLSFSVPNQQRSREKTQTLHTQDWITLCSSTPDDQIKFLCSSKPDDQIKLLGELVLRYSVKCLYDREFDLDIFFYFKVTSSAIIWHRILLELCTHLRQHGRRYASSMLRRSERLKSAQCRSQPLSKVASVWAIEAVYGLIRSGYSNRHNQHENISEHVMNLISQTHSRILDEIRKRKQTEGKRYQLG